MRMMKLSSILLLSMFFIWVFTPEASARCRSRTSFGLSFNVGSPGYVVAPAPAPTYVAPAPVYPTYPAYVAPAPAPYPYYYNAPVVVESPGYYVQPGFSYSHWRRY